MVTNPPYNVSKDYDKDMSLDEYLSFLILQGFQEYNLVFLKEITSGN